MRRCFFVACLTSVLACTPAHPPSADVRSGEVRSADGVLIRYDARGSGEPALVLVHGWTNSRDVWGEHPRTLARTHRVITLDLAGHGASGDNRRNWTMDAFGDDVAAVVAREAPRRVVLVGFSMGGIVVLEAAERLGDRVAGIVFVDTFHDPDRLPSDAQFDQMMTTFRSSWGDTAFLRAFAYTPDTPDSLIVRMRASQPDTPREHWFAVAGAMRQWMKTESATALSRVRAPLAAINAARIPTNLAALRRHVPGFTLDTMHGVGHAGILHQRVADFDARLLGLVRRLSAREGG